MRLVEWGLGRRVWPVAAAVCAFALVLALAPAWAGNGPSAGTGSKIASAVVDDLQRNGTGDFWVVLGGSQGTGGAQGIEDWTARGQRVVDQLKANAKDAQSEVRKVLDARGLKYRSFWVTNAILVRGGTMTAANQLAGLGAVAEIRAPRKYEPPEPVKVEETSAKAAGVEWGVASIKADQAWERFGTRGEGIVVANIDSGVQFDHPALARSYRGANGDGTFTHDYNWLDTVRFCAGAPCDANSQSSHGTHTMGTMAGDDGAGNQIGVAPGAKWIATNGCASCFEEDLVESAQWLLAPTDADGGNADVSKRPHIVNNSWGSRFPSNDPFLEDILTAWRDAGIFSAWANGNLGPNCATSGTPGSRALNYSVGAYDRANAIAPFSSRGPGQSGEIKPNIAAPGVSVRSAQQGDFYGALSGTSMAAPHLAGAVALLWSAEPSLVGDVAATRELLDLTAVDTASTQCGGTTEDNNVYGEGRLDALALLEAGTRGDAGTLTGTITDGQTGQPVHNATIAVSGPIEREATAGSAGTYSLRVVPGDYEVEVRAFGYETSRRTVHVDADESVTHDVALTPLDTVTVTGAVLDGGGHDWPLYARIAVEGAQVDSIFTNPYTGRYRLELPSNSTFTLRVTAQYPGYQVVEDVVHTGVGALRHDIEVPIDAQACNAPGYDFAVTGAGTSFDERTLPDGWTVTDNNGAGGTWSFDDPGNRGNQTGGSDGFAIFDGDYLPDFIRWDSTLMSPVADLREVPNPVLTFNIDYTSQSPGLTTGEIDLSLDGGETWENVWRRTSGGMRRLPVRIDLPQAAGQQRARIRFRYTTLNTGWWQIDDVVFGVERCAPTRGGLVLGQVVDGNTGAPLAGASIVSADAPAQKTTSAATPNDPALADGFYWLFSSEVGGHDFTATRPGYQPHTREVNVPPHWTTQADFTLRAGRLVIEPASVTATQTLGQATSKAVTFSNTGTAPVDVTLREDGGDMTPLAQAEGAPERRIQGRFTPGRAAGFGAAAQAFETPFAPPWTAIANYPTPIMDNGVVTADDGTVYSIGGTTTGGRTVNAVLAYDPRSGSWTGRAAMGWEREAPAAAHIDGKVYVIGGWWTSGLPVDALEIYNPGTNSWSNGAQVPVAHAASGVGVVDDTMYVVGGCDYTTCGSTDVFAYRAETDTWRQVADYPEPVSFVACGAIGGKLYCAGGARDGGTTRAAYVYDPRNDGWVPVAPLPRDVWAGGHAAANGRLLISGGAVDGGSAITNQGLAYDPVADAWTAIPNSNETVFRGGASCGFYKVGGSVGGFSPIPRSEVLPGFGKCGAAAELPWLSADRTSFSLAPGERITVTLRFDASVEAVSQPGTYSGRITVANDSPYPAALDASMVVRPPTSWGKIAGTVTGVRCDGSRIPLPGATLAIDGALGAYTLRTDADGKYGHWLDRRNNPLQVIVSLDGWRPQTRRVRITAGTTTTADFALARTGGC